MLDGSGMPVAGIGDGANTETGVDRAQKQKLVEALQQDLADTPCVVVTHQTGLIGRRGYPVAAADARRRGALSGDQEPAGAARLGGTPFAALAPLFTGPTAIAFSRDPVAAAKVAVEFANRNAKLTIIGGGLAGELIDAGRGQGAGEPALARRIARRG